MMMIARRSDVLLGEYALIMAFYFVMQMLPLLGLTTFVMREVARAPSQAGKFFATIGFLSILGCVLVNLLTDFAMQFFSYSSSVEQGVRILGFIIVPGILIFICEIIFMSLYQAKPVGLIALSENLSRIVLSMLVLSRNGELKELMWVFLLTRLCALSIYVVLMYRQRILVGIPRPDLDLITRTFRVLPAFLMGTLLLAFLGRLDFFVLSISEAVEVIGYYAIGYRVFDISIVILSGLIMALFPYLSRKFVQSKLQYRVALRITLLGFAAGLSLFCFIAILFGEYYVLLLFANQYPYPLLATQLFMAILVIAGIDHLCSSLLHSSDMQIEDTRALTLGAFFYVAALFFLVPAVGILGAIAARLIHNLAQLIFRLRALEKTVCGMLALRDIFRVLALMAVLGVIALLTVDANLWLKILVSLFAVTLGPALMVVIGLFQPLRILRFFRRNREKPDSATMSGLLDMIAMDLRRYSRYHNAQGRRNTNRHVLNKSQIAVLLYRISHYFHCRGMRGIAQKMTRVGSKVTGVVIAPDSEIGPGFVFSDGDKAYIRLNAGKNLTCSGNINVGNEIEEKRILGNFAMLHSNSCQNPKQ